MPIPAMPDFNTAMSVWQGLRSVNTANAGFFRALAPEIFLRLEGMRPPSALGRGKGS